MFYQSSLSLFIAPYNINKKTTTTKLKKTYEYQSKEKFNKNNKLLNKLNFK